MTLTQPEIQKRKSDRLNQMTQEIGAGESHKAFLTKVLRNWEDCPKNNKANQLLIELAKEFKV